MHVVTASERRTTSTPNASMTTLASPTLGAAGSSLWLVEMVAHAEGPEHAFADEVLWAITRGRATVTCEGAVSVLGAGDTVVLPGGAMRRFVAGDEGFGAVVTTRAPGDVTRGDGTKVGAPEWVA